MAGRLDLLLMLLLPLPTLLSLLLLALPTLLLLSMTPRLELVFRRPPRMVGMVGELALVVVKRRQGGLHNDRTIVAAVVLLDRVMAAADVFVSLWCI